MILYRYLNGLRKVGITRTCGGDPGAYVLDENCDKVLPAHAGVILSTMTWELISLGITRTCGGDPMTRWHSEDLAGYYPDMRG